MTTTYSSETQPAGAGLLRGIVRWIAIGVNNFAVYLHRRAAIKALRQLDDRALRDIGLARCHIEAAVGGAFNPDMGRMR